MGSRRMWVIGGILLIVLSAVIIGWQVWDRYQQSKAAVVVAAVRINKGTVIQEAMLTTREIAATTAADPNILRNPKEVVGKLAQSDIPEGVVIVQAFLAERVEPGRVLGSGVVIPVGWRAVPLSYDKLDATSRGLIIGGALQAGDHVDIYKGELVTATLPEQEPGKPISPVVVAPTVVPLPNGSPRVEYTLVFSDVIVGDLLDATGKSLLGTAGDQAVTVLFLLPERSDAKKLLEVSPSVRVTLLGYERP